MPVVVLVFIVALNHETVVYKFKPVAYRPLADNFDGEAVQLTDLRVQSARCRVLGNLLQTLPDNLLVGGIQSLNLDRIEPVAGLVCLGGSQKLLSVFRHGMDVGGVVPQLSGL